ncbi:MAG TPA: MBL fold metallo-hydrolase [Candidatus Aquabacterium excrementipullorum]|nr:MBL fold metallo-hydrolase [Candidatus Aquabacterium excrementipullorum]
MTRRVALRAGSALLAMAALLPFASMPVQAEAPQLKTQVPGYYRHALGDFEVTVLHDGQIKLDTKILKNLRAGEMQKLLALQFRDNPTPTAVNAFLVNTGKQLVLVDTGAAKVFGPTLGQVVANLKAAGYDPAQVDAVLLTHLHGDHAGGLLGADGQRVFPKATVYVAQAEANYWLAADAIAKAPEAMKGFFKIAQDATAPYAQAGALKTFTGTTEVLPGFKALPAPGHTPGHTGYLIESKGHRLLVWGDLVHNVAIQLPHPDVTIEFDTDAAVAARTRKALLSWTAKDAGLLVGGMHLPFPGLGHVREEGRGRYSWVPIDFAPWPDAP